MQDIISDLLNSPFAIVLFAIFLIVFLILILVLTRYRTFKPNEYVIWLRRGRIRRVGIGGSVIKLPLFDEIYTIPTMLQIEYDGKRQSLLQWVKDYKSNVPEGLLETVAKIQAEKNSISDWESEMGYIKIIFETKPSQKYR